MPDTKFKPFPNELLAQLDTAHGDIRPVPGAKPPPKPWAPDFVPETPWAAVFRRPTVGESDNFEGAAHNEKARTAALRNLAKATVVAVSFNGKHTVCLDRGDAASVRAVREAWEELRTNGYPSAHLAAQDDLMSLSGQVKDEQGKD